jgi:hypothetical protein
VQAEQGGTAPAATPHLHPHPWLAGVRSHSRMVTGHLPAVPAGGPAADQLPNRATVFPNFAVKVHLFLSANLELVISQFDSIIACIELFPEFIFSFGICNSHGQGHSEKNRFSLDKKKEMTGTKTGKLICSVKYVCLNIYGLAT